MAKFKGLNKEEALNFIRTLFDASEGEEITLNGDMYFVQKEKKMEMELSEKAGQIKLEVKEGLIKAKEKNATKSAEIVNPSQKKLEQSKSIPTLPDYKPLKKRMKEDFKKIVLAVKKERLPPEDLAAGFLDDCRLMTSYPDRGEEYYEAFNNAAVRFDAAMQTKDIAQLAKSVEELDRLRGLAHDKYK